VTSVSDRLEDGDPETEYLALVENPSLLALTLGVARDSIEGVAEVTVPVTVPESAGVKEVGVPGELGDGWPGVDIRVRFGTEVVAGTEDILRFVDEVEITGVTMTEDSVRGELVEVEVVMRAAGASEAEGGLSDDVTFVFNGGAWIVGDASSSVLITAPSGPFWFPSGPGGPFLFPSRPGTFVFAGPRAVRNRRLVSL
jgi:hypothetical protein